MAEQSDWSVKKGLRTADQEIEAFRSAVTEQNFTSAEGLTSRMQNVFRAELGGVPSVLRVVTHVSPAASERHTNAFHRLARALSPDRMSSPAAVTRFAQGRAGVPANTDIVVTEHAPATYVEGDKTARGTLRKVGAQHRHLGAILSYVAHLADHEIRRNLLFSAKPDGEFPFWFIDLDFAFGDTMSWGYGRPIFFPGGRLDYQAEGRAPPLPPRAGELLDLIHGLPVQDVARMFGLLPVEADDLQTRCSTAKRLGLAAAIGRERFWGPGDSFLTRWREAAYAKITKAVTAYRLRRF